MFITVVCFFLMLGIVVSFKHSSLALIKVTFNLSPYQVVFLISVNFLSLVACNLKDIFLPRLVLLRNLYGLLEQCIYVVSFAAVFLPSD